MADFIGYIAPPGPVVEPPVHGETIVDVFWSDGDTTDEHLAGQTNWSAEGDGPHVVAYRGVREYVEPKKPHECFGVIDRDGDLVEVFCFRAIAEEAAKLFTDASVIRMAEVME